MKLFTLLHRQFRHHRAASVLLVCIILVVSGLLAAWPRAINAMYTEDLQQSVGELTASQRNMSAFAPAAPVVSDNEQAFLTPADLERQLASIRAGFPELLKSSVEDAQWVSTATETGIIGDLPDGVYELKPSFAIAPGLLDHAALTEGRLPEPLSSQDLGKKPLEIILSTHSAEGARWDVGEVRAASLASPLVPSGPADSGLVTESDVVLTGIYEAKDPSAGYWSMAPALLNPTILNNPDRGDSVSATAVIHVGSGDSATAFTAKATLSVWYELQPSALNAQTATALGAQLGQVAGQSTSLDADAGLLGLPLMFRSETADTVSDVTERASTTNRILALLASGPLGVCLLTAVIAIRLVLDRRRNTLALVAARGASGLQLRAALMAEGLLLGLPAAAVGTAVALLLVPGPVEPSQFVWPALTALAPAAIFAFTRLKHDDGPATLGNRRWRFVAEGAVVLAAIGSVTALLSRGGSGTSTVDPVLSAAPLLIAIAVSLLVLRLYPLPLAWWSRRQSASPGLLYFLGPVRSVRSAVAALVPLMALTVGVAVVVFSGTFLSTFQDGVAKAARYSVPADLLVDTAPLDNAQLEEVEGIGGVATVAALSDFSAASPQLHGNDENSPHVWLVDAEALKEVQAGYPGAIPSSLLDELSTTTDGPLPMIASNGTGLAPGDEGEIRFYGEAEVAVAASLERISLLDSSYWVLLDRDNVRDRLGIEAFAGKLLIKLAPGADVQQVKESVAEISGISGSQLTPSEYQERILESPSAKGLQVGLWTVVAFMGLLSALIIIMTTLVNAPGRNRLIALLRTLGFPPSRDRGLLLWELIPPAAVALVVGTGVGLLLPTLVTQAVDLRVFTGGPLPVGLAPDPLQLGLLLGGFVLVVLGSIAAAVAVGRRQRVAAVLRIGEE